MALSLNQIKEKRNTASQSQPRPHKVHVARPWETFDKLGNQTRTITAQEAVHKARSVVPRAPLFMEPIVRFNPAPAPIKIKTSVKAGNMFDFLSFLF